MSTRKGTGIMSKDTVILNSEKLLAAIKKSGVTMTKLSKLVLNRGDTYISEALRDSRCKADDLKKLCDFLDLKYDEIVVPKETETKKDKPIEVKTPSQVVNLDALILGINNLYQIEKDNAETMKQLLEQVRATNIKLGRFENLLGQMHANTIGIKDNTKELENVMRENKSSVAGIAGRVRDLTQQFKR